MRIFLTILLLCGLAAAEQVVLIDGDIINGQTKSIKAGNLIFISESLGELKIPLSKIQQYEMAEPIAIILEGESTGVDRQLKIDGENILIIENGMARKINLADIIDSGREIVDPFAFKTDFRGDMGVSGRSGNISRVSYMTDFRYKADNPHWSYNAYFNSRYGTQKRNGNKIKTDDKMKFGGRAGRKLSHKLFAYAASDFEIDSIGDIDLLSVLTAGLEVRWLDKGNFKYTNRAGFGYQHKKYSNQDSESSAIGSLESDLLYKLNSRVEFQQETSYRPVLDDAQEYRITSDTSARIFLNDTNSLYIRMGLKHDYDSRPAEGKKQLDTYYFTNIGFRF